MGILTHTHSVYILTGTHLGSSDKAVKFRTEELNGIPLDSPDISWWPNSQITKTIRSPNESCDELAVSRWIVQQKHLI
jgi:hypothetical protein